MKLVQRVGEGGILNAYICYWFYNNGLRLIIHIPLVLKSLRFYFRWQYPNRIIPRVFIEFVPKRAPMPSQARQS